MKRTFIDSNILITAFSGEEPLSQKAMEIIEDPERKLVVSDYVRLEILPKPTFNNKRDAVEFYQAVFDNAENIPPSTELIGKAIEVASKYDVSSYDALHIGAAVISNVDEFLTFEKPTKPMFRVEEIKVTSLNS